MAVDNEMVGGGDASQEKITALVLDARGNFEKWLSSAPESAKDILTVAGGLPIKYNHFLTKLDLQQIGFNAGLERGKFKKQSEYDTVLECQECAVEALKLGTKATNQKPPTSILEVGVKGVQVMMQSKTAPRPLKSSSRKEIVTSSK